jgi:hypothetical protein
VSIPRHRDLDVLASVERSLRDEFRTEPARASITFLGVDSLEVLRFDVGVGTRTYISLGMSRHPMTALDAPVQAGATGPRAELLVDVRGADDGLWRRLAMLASAPAVEGVVYRDGMTVDLSGPLVAGSRCTGVLVEESHLREVSVAERIVVRILRVIPITSTELAWCRVHGSAALRERWTMQRVDLLDLGRLPAVLS